MKARSSTFQLTWRQLAITFAWIIVYLVTPQCRAQHAAYTPGVYGTWPLATQISSSETSCTLTTQSTLLYENSGVVGILLVAPWASIDTGTSAPSYNWTALNDRLNEIQLCATPQRPLSIAISLQTALTSLPPWVQTQESSMTTVNLGTTIGTVPVFWDTTFNNDRVAFIQAAATDLAAQPGFSNVVAVQAQPFGATSDDWNVPHSTNSGGVNQVTNWQQAGYTTTNMLSAAERIIAATGTAFPTLNLKLPIQVTSSSLDPDPNDSNDVTYLAQEVVAYAYSKYPNRFYAQLNFLNSTKSPNDYCVGGSCGTPDWDQSPEAVFDILGYYQSLGYGVGIQDVDAAVNGFVSDSGTYCRQYGTDTQYTCTPCDTTYSSNPNVSYATVAQDAWNIAATYTPTYWEIWNGDAVTTTGNQNSCSIDSSGQAGMRSVYSSAMQAMQQ